MKRALVFSVVALALFVIVPAVSAQVIINTQPQSVYNFGDAITIPVTLKTTTNVAGTFYMDLLCNGNEVNFYQNGVSISAGQEENIDGTLIITKGTIGGLSGTCKIKAYLGSDYALTNEFTISSSINLNATFSSLQLNPGDTLTVKGTAVKEDGKSVDGLLNLSLILGNSSAPITQLGTVNNGEFSVNMVLPKSMSAGEYLLETKVYEQDISGNITNSGLIDKNIAINQVPTSLEIIFENSSVEPGTNVKVKAILHDQTGNPINSQVFITIKDNNSKILSQEEVPTGQFVNYSIAYDTAPEIWNVVAVSNKITSQSTFNIVPKESVDIQVINQTIIATNKGNVPYNKTALIKIGNSTLNLNIYLGVDQSQKYTLSAPDGKYKVEISVGANNSISKEVSLTGNAVDVKKSGSGVSGFMSSSLLWVFVIFILGFVAFIVYRKGYQKTFIGYISSKRGHKKKPVIENPKQAIIIPAKNRAELSLSIKGEKQDVSVVALKMKNIKDLEKKNEGTSETFRKLADLADSVKATTYENHDTVFFLFVPAITRTFKNEKSALELAMKIKEILIHHNKLFKQRIDFGISMNYGSIIAKREQGVLKFMSMGTLVTSSKKIASEAKEELLLSEKIYDRMRADIKAVKHTRDGIAVFIVSEIRHSEDHSKFLRGFLNRMEHDKSKDKKE